MNISVIGCGRWGSLITWYLDKTNHSVLLYGRENSKHMQEFFKSRKNDLLELPLSVNLTTKINDVLENEVIVISVNSQGLRALLNQLTALEMKNKTIVLCMKGIEVSSQLRLSQIAEETIDKSNKVAVWLGPGHVQEFYNGTPNCMVIDSNHLEVKDLLVKEFSSNLIRFYYGQDLIGNEIGAAAKNVIGIAAGMLDGANLSTLKGALMSRGTREIARLIEAMGGNELSAYGLCHLGDYEATVFSKFSHNRQYGENFIKGKDYTSLAEGYYTVKALVSMGKSNNVDLPICNAVYEILYEKKDPAEVLNGLFQRSLKNEF